MRNTFVTMKSHLTFAKELYEAVDFKTYRVRIECTCQNGQNIRDGILVLNNDDNFVMTKVIKCKACSGRKGAGHV